MAAPKSNRCTEGELQTARNVTRRFAIQEATLDARLRTGLRYGVEVCGGAMDVVLHAYATDAKGRPTGVASTEIVAARLNEAQAIAALKALR